MLRSASRSGAVALTSAALMGLSALAIPAVAAADDASCAPEDVTYSVTGGTLDWGFKQSYRAYAGGYATYADGASAVGTITAPEGRFSWPVTGGDITDNDTASANGRGSVNFTAHGGAMNTTIANPTVELDGTDGVIKMDYEGLARTGGGTVEGTQVEAARFTLDSAADFHSDTTVNASSGVAKLSESFVEVFGTYTAGTDLDPVHVNLEITASCEPGGDNNGGDNGGDGDDNTGGGIFGSLGTIFGSLGF